MASRAAPPAAPGNRRTALIMAAIAAAMLALGYAAVPLYRIFCQVSGYGGTPRRASEAAAARAAAQGGGRTISVRFDANVAPGLPWVFRPDRITQTVRIGERQLTTFYAKNLSARPITGTAMFNIQPDESARYFNKIQCFCFSRQRLEPGQEVHMPVIYFVDPAILADKDNRGVEQITLSYTFTEAPETRASAVGGSAAKPLDPADKRG